jgi:hypothetical protein
MPRDLIARIASAASLDTYGSSVGLAAFDSAGIPGGRRGRQHTCLNGAGALDARPARGGWSWAPTEAISDTDTTEMAISVLARYAPPTRTCADAIAAALDLLAPGRLRTGPWGAATHHAMMLIALGRGRHRRGKRHALCRGRRKPAQWFVPYRTADGRFGYKNNRL